MLLQGSASVFSSAVRSCYDLSAGSSFNDPSAFFGKGDARTLECRAILLNCPADICKAAFHSKKLASPLGMILNSSPRLLASWRLVVLNEQMVMVFWRAASQGDSLVLDLCAAPGSKTSQLLEALHQAAERERRCTGSASAEWPALPSMPMFVIVAARRCAVSFKSKTSRNFVHLIGEKPLVASDCSAKLHRLIVLYLS